MRADPTGSQRFFTGPSHVSQRNVKNVIPADWNYDGRLDLLVVTEGQRHGWWGGGSDELEMQALIQGSDGGFGASAWLSTVAQVGVPGSDFGSSRKVLLDGGRYMIAHGQPRRGTCQRLPRPSR